MTEITFIPKYRLIFFLKSYTNGKYFQVINDLNDICSRTTVWRVIYASESADYAPSIDTLQRIAKVLNVKLDDLINTEKEPIPFASLANNKM